MHQFESQTHLFNMLDHSMRKYYTYKQGDHETTAVHIKNMQNIMHVIEHHGDRLHQDEASINQEKKELEKEGVTNLTDEELRKRQILSTGGPQDCKTQRRYQRDPEAVHLQNQSIPQEPNGSLLPSYSSIIPQQQNRQKQSGTIAAGKRNRRQVVQRYKERIFIKTGIKLQKQAKTCLSIHTK